jgi:hypothetical protein
MKYLTSIFLLAFLSACQNTPKPEPTKTTTFAVKPTVFNPQSATPPHPEQKPKELTTA